MSAFVSGCGGDDDGGRSALIVAAAASLTEPVRACAPDIRLSLAGSDELAAQVRQGAPVDVFLAANTALPAQLAEEGVLAEPVAFATNALVVAVPAESAVDGVEDLAADGVGVAIGAEGVPVGDYTRDVLGRLPAAQRRGILANVRTEEPDVKGVVGKLTQGAVDAGFVYASDVRAASGRLRAIALPAPLEPDVAYGGGIVAATEHPDEAAAFLAGMTEGACADALRDAGFGPPP